MNAPTIDVELARLLGRAALALFLLIIAGMLVMVSGKIK
jgi:hypothetical protein